MVEQGGDNVYSPMPIPSSACEVIRKLTNANYEVYVVGGCVRDHLRGLPPHDYDMTTNATPEEMVQVFRDMRCIETGLKHGTLTVLSDGEPHEVTTYRVDGEYLDHRHPKEVTFTRDLTGDLSRRDFTMNAIAYHPDKGYIDLFGGMADIEAHCIRAVGEPKKRFEEDALRILRAIRFAAVTGFEIEEKTKAALFASKELLSHISVERIREELLKLLSGEHALQVLREYRDIIGICLPEVVPMFDCPQNTPYHLFDVWEHSIQVVDRLPNEPFLRFIGLLHDVAKPLMRTTDRFGQDHFKGHPLKGAEVVVNIMTRLRFDSKSIEKARLLVLHHDDRTPPKRNKVLRLLAKVGYENFLTLCTLAKADSLSQNTNHPVNIENRAALEETLLLGIALETEGACYQIKDLAVGGGDVISITGAKGPLVGHILETLLLDVMDGKVENNQEEIQKYLEKIRIERSPL